MDDQVRVYAGHTVGGNDRAGTFSVSFTLNGADGTQSRLLTGVVDTRKLHTIVPREILEALGIKREHYRRFRREDGFVRNLGVGLVRIELQGHVGSTHIVFGDDRHETVIGSMTLARFALAVDPDQEKLIPGVLTL